MRPGDDGNLVALAQRGDRRAFEELARRHEQKAYHVAFSFTRDREEAKDLSQEAFLKAFTHLKNFDGRSSFYTWFYRILVNLCLDHKRRRQHGATVEFDESVETTVDAAQPADGPRSPDQQVLARQMSIRVGQALDRLPARQRTAFILKNHQGLSIREISELMETAEGTVKAHLHRAVTALRQQLADFV